MSAFNLYLQDVGDNNNDTDVSKFGSVNDDRTWVESLFESEATKRGFSVARVLSGYSRYDCIIDKNNKLKRVQVKSTTVIQHHSTKNYSVNIWHLDNKRNTLPYSKEVVDFIVAYIIPETVWYIFPIEVVGTRSSNQIQPYNYTHIHNKYRDAWDILEDKERYDLRNW